MSMLTKSVTPHCKVFDLRYTGRNAGIEHVQVKLFCCRCDTGCVCRPMVASTVERLALGAIAISSSGISSSAYGRASELNRKRNSNSAAPSSSLHLASLNAKPSYDWLHFARLVRSLYNDQPASYSFEASVRVAARGRRSSVSCNCPQFQDLRPHNCGMTIYLV